MELLRAVLDADEPTAAGVAAELVRHDMLVMPAPGRYLLTEFATGIGGAASPDTGAVKAAISWFVDQAVAADRARDRYAAKVSPAYDTIGAPKFRTPADAMAWYTPHHSWFMALLNDLVDRKWYELSITLAEAVFGLAGHNGLHRDQVDAATHAVHSLNALYWKPGWIGGDAESDDRTRQYDLRFARFKMKLASALRNLGDLDGALVALEEAEERGRALADVRVLAAVARGRGWLLYTAGDWVEAERELRRARVLDDAFGNLRRIALGKRRLGAVLSRLGRFEEALAELDGAAAAMLELGDHIAHARVLTETGALFVAADEPQKAIAPLTTALATTEHEEAGCDAYLADIYRYLAQAHKHLNDPSYAEHCFTKAVEHYRRAHRDTDAAAVESTWHES
ncbi:tetratricopeptide repeat protein [Lentzea xinjiangensis]|uniref:tetratricopeptide repeat protein n=1 Tax=Lentzea xinjiangensis TaxID=402600 RepID=UPI0015A70A0E|nr:tetratricopeptide repeat protein [Lentzea xinjiangensis]